MPVITSATAPVPSLDVLNAATAPLTADGMALKLAGQSYEVSTTNQDGQPSAIIAEMMDSEPSEYSPGAVNDAMRTLTTASYFVEDESCLSGSARGISASSSAVFCASSSTDSDIKIAPVLDRREMASDDAYKQMAQAISVTALFKNDSWGSYGSVSGNYPDGSGFEKTVWVPNSGVAVVDVPRESENVEVTWQQGTWSGYHAPKITPLNNIKNLHYVTVSSSGVEGVEIKPAVYDYRQKSVDLVNEIEGASYNNGWSNSASMSEEELTRIVDSVINKVPRNMDDWGIEEAMRTSSRVLWSYCELP